MSAPIEFPPLDLDAVKQHAPHVQLGINPETGNIGGICLLPELTLPDVPPNHTFVYDADSPRSCFIGLQPDVAKAYTPDRMAVIALAGVGLDKSAMYDAYGNQANDLIDDHFTRLGLEDKLLGRLDASYQHGLLYPWRAMPLEVAAQTTLDRYKKFQYRTKYTRVRDSDRQTLEDLKQTYALPSQAAALMLARIAEWQLQPKVTSDIDGSSGMHHEVHAPETREAFMRRLKAEGVGKTIDRNGLAIAFDYGEALTPLEQEVLTLWLLDITPKETLVVLGKSRLAKANVSSIVMSAQKKLFGRDIINRSHAIGLAVEKDYIQVGAHEAPAPITDPLHKAVALLAPTGQSNNTITHHLQRTAAFSKVGLEDVAQARQELFQLFNASSISELTMALYGTILDKRHAPVAYHNDHKALLNIPLAECL
jgi:hypothetical protein